MPDYGDIFEAAGREWNVDPRLLRAVSSVESGGDASARSKAGAQGLMQIIPETQRALGITDPLDPAQSIYGGAKYLSQALDAEKTPEDALRYYHGGPGWRSAYGPESAAYAPKVIDAYSRLGTQPVAKQAQAPADDPFGAALAQAKQAAGNDNAPSSASDASEADPFTAALDAARKAPKTAEATAPTDTQQTYEGSAGEDVAGAMYGGGVPSIPSIPTVAEARNALIPPAGYATSNVLPLAFKQAPDGSLVLPSGNTFGARLASAASLVRPDLGPLRAPANAMLDLLEGTGQATSAGGANSPLAGKVSPEATNLLLGAAMGGGLAPSLARGTGIAISDAAAAPLSAEFKANPIAAGARLGEAPAAEAGPSPGMGAPVPNAVGAQASTSAQAMMTPAQIAAYRSTAEGRKLLESQQPGVPDLNAYIPGVEVNSAEMEQTVNTARELKRLHIEAPAVSQEAKEVADKNSGQRQRFFESRAGSDVDIDNAETFRSAQAEADTAAILAHAKPARPQPAYDALKKVLDDERNENRESVQKNLAPYLDRMMTKDGNLKTSPSALWGIRDDLSEKLDKIGVDPQSTMGYVKKEALLFRKALDQVLNEATDGHFQTYLDNYAAASRPIDTMRVLQKFEPKLYGAQNRMEYGRVQSMMRQLVDARSGPDPIHPAKSIPDETMSDLWNLRDDLRRAASAQELARTPGSDTSQTGWDLIKNAASGPAGTIGAHLGGLAASGPAAAAVMGFGKNLVANALSQRTLRKNTKRGMEILHPDQSRLRDPNAP